MVIWLKTVFGLPGPPLSDMEYLFTKELVTSAPRGDAVNEFIYYLMKTFITSDSKFPPILRVESMGRRKLEMDVNVSTATLVVYM